MTHDDPLPLESTQMPIIRIRQLIISFVKIRQQQPLAD
jgi:hypothetical protein